MSAWKATPQGRAGEPAATTLSARLKELKLPQGRLKTGTPPRLDGRTIDYSKMVEQPGDGVAPGGEVVGRVPVFSFLGDASRHPRQMSCWITHTNERTHEIIRGGFSGSPMFTGKIDGVGPRYCPSIEDKVNRFAEKASHQIFLEPEGLQTTEVYPNGISTSLPFDVQLAAVRSIAGLENAHVLRPGYAIEYDYFDPRALSASFETRAIRRLFFAGQINGTTGYEEAAAQGLHAGINAALAARGAAAWVTSRGDAYLGVLIDDLVSKGVTEPYRMFTSRAEHRLLLREDNADARLTPAGRLLGVVDDERWKAFGRKQDGVSRETSRLAAARVGPCRASDGFVELTRDYLLMELLRRPEASFDKLGGWLALAGRAVDVSRETLRAEHGDAEADAIIEQIEIAAKYSGYIDKQTEQIDRVRRSENLPLPDAFDFDTVHALSHEVRQLLARHRPATLGAAARLPGVTPAAIALMLVHLKKHRSPPITPSDAGEVSALV